jgi:hypothetical protein
LANYGGKSKKNSTLADGFNQLIINKWTVLQVLLSSLAQKCLPNGFDFRWRHAAGCCMQPQSFNASAKTRTTLE